MRRPMILLLVLSLCLSLGLQAFATETTAPAEPTNVPRAPGYCGETIAWEYTNGVLNITGTGVMDDFPEGAPWEEYKNEMHTVIISGGITYLGAWSFCDYDKITTVEFGKDIYEIGERAFFSCDGLTAINLPKSFRIFGPSSFMGCSNLKEIHCKGSFPSFRLNCTLDTYAVIYFPAERPWPLEHIKQYEEATRGRIEFLASDGTDPYDPAAETEAPTEAATEPPTQPVTEPMTEPPTEETAAPTEPETSAPTVVITQPQEETTEPEPTQATPEETEEPQVQPPVKKKNLTGYLILGGAAAFLILGTLVFGGGRKRGKYSR